MERRKQRKLGVRTSFEFGETELVHEFRSLDGIYQATVAYDWIRADSPESLAVRSPWFKFVALLSVPLIYAASLHIFDYTEKTIVFLSGILSGVTIAYLTSVVRYSVLHTTYGSIFVIRDSAHDDILSEIRRRRRTLLREKYFHVDTNASLKSELDKYRLLLEEGAITQAEYVRVSEDLLARA
jgi:hypothetical protein